MRKTPFKEILKEKAVQMLDRIDPLELAATLALIPILEPLMEKAVIAGTITTAAFSNWIKIWSFPILGMPSLAGGTQEEIDKIIGEGKIGFYLLTFVVAFVVVRHAGDFARAGIEGIGGIVKILGITAAA